MNTLLELSHESIEVLEARSDDIYIYTGKAQAGPSVEKKHYDHEVTIPGKQSAATLTYQSAAGTPGQIKISDRHVIIIPAGHTHSVEWNRPAERTTIMIKASFLNTLAKANGIRGANMAGHFAAIDPFIWHMGRGIEHQLRVGKRLEKSYLDSVAIVIGQHLLSVYIDTPAAGFELGGLPRYKLKRAIEFIHANYRDDIGFRDIARELDMSPYHFARLFRHSSGESPHQVIMRCRIECAKRLLIEEAMTIADIAIEVGYKSQSYFTTRFAELVGMTPAAFRGTPRPKSFVK